MAREALTFGAIIAGVVLGTAVLLFGEASSSDALILGGGVLALLSVGGLTTAITRA
jgi:hypothetical protein